MLELVSVSMEEFDTYMTELSVRLTGRERLRKRYTDFTDGRFGAQYLDNDDVIHGEVIWSGPNGTNVYLIRKETSPQNEYVLRYPDKGELPEPGRFVLAHLNKTNWHNRDDQEGVMWVVVRLVKGITVAEREALSEGDPRKKQYSSGDEWANNKRGYSWNTFGPSSFFGQEVDYWTELPRGVTP